MKKSRISYILTLCVALSVGILCSNAGAISEQISYNFSNIALFGRTQIEKGEDFTAKNGQEVPASILYVDEAGGTSNFLSVSKIAEILDADIKWNGREQTVDFGTATTPGANVVNFPFEELTPQGAVQQADDAEAWLKNAVFQSESAFNQTFYCPPRFGEFIIVKVANHGEKPVSFAVSRDKTIGNQQPFPTDVIQPGEAATRIFSINEAGNELTSNLNVHIAPLQGRDAAPLNIVVDVSQQDTLGTDAVQRSLTPPASEEYDGLSVKLEEATADKVTITLVNDSKRNFQYGGDYIVEKLVDGKWAELQQAENAATLPVAHEIRAGQERSMEFAVGALYGTLSEGKYRIKLPVSEIGSQQVCCYLTADFEV